MGSQQASKPACQPFTLCLCCFVSGFGRHKHNSESRLPVRQQCRGCFHGGQSPSGLPTMVWTAFLLHHHCMKPACHVPCAMCDVELVAWAPVDLLVVPLSLFLPQLQTVPHAIGVERGTRKPRCSPQLPSYQPTSFTETSLHLPRLLKSSLQQLKARLRSRHIQYFSHGGATLSTSPPWPAPLASPQLHLILGLPFQ
jgi:hypothetical protein